MPRYATYATPRLDLGEAMSEYVIGAEDFIATAALPISEVNKPAGVMTKIERETEMLAPTGKRAPGAGYARTVPSAEDDTYACYEYGFEGPLDDGDREKYKSDMDAELETVKHITNKLLRAQEARVAAALFNTTTWTGATLYTDYSSSAPWSTTSSDVMTQIITAKQAVRSLTGMDPNALIINRTNLDRLSNNDDLIGRIVYTEKAGYSAVVAALASLFELEMVLVGGSYYNAAPEGATISVSPQWSNLYAMVAVIPPAGSLKDPGVGRTMLWADDSPSNVVVEQYRDEPRRSDVFRVRHNVDEKIIDASYAHLLKVATS